MMARFTSLAMGSVFFYVVYQSVIRFLLFLVLEYQWLEYINGTHLIVWNGITFVNDGRHQVSVVGKRLLLGIQADGQNGK